MLILGLESSCDETAAAIVNEKRQILSNVIISQINPKYQGIVPELVARSHLQSFDYVISAAIEQANIDINSIDAIATTCGPGLIGGLIVGSMYGKSLASVLNKKFIAINHLEAHALTARLVDPNLQYPYLLLLISGGHTQFLAIQDFQSYRLLGQTLDDSLGEAFDKTAKLLGLGYPGGEMIEKRALEGDSSKYMLPLPMCNVSNLDMSFSGIKTAVRNLVSLLVEQNTKVLSIKNQEDHALRITPEQINDVCASFQAAICKILRYKTVLAIEKFKEISRGKEIVIAGGVASNMAIRYVLEQVAFENGFKFTVAPPKLCTDNAAMIAWAGIENLSHGIYHNLDFTPRPKWDLQDLKPT